MNVLVLKATRSRDAARTSILAHDHEMRIWDAVMLSVAATAECRLLLSEDLQDGFTWRGVTVANPLRATQHTLLVSLLTPEGEG